MASRVFRRLAELLDVTLSSPQDGDVLTYNGAAWENAVSTGGGGGGWPVRDMIIGYNPPKAESGFDNLGQPTSDYPVHGTRYSDDANGAWIEWYTALAAGTYALVFRGYSFSGSGILSFSLNGTAINQAPYSASSATVDTYSGSGNPYFLTVVCNNLTIPDSDTYVLRATISGKNASSTGYVTNVELVELTMVVAA